MLRRGGPAGSLRERREKTLYGVCVCVCACACACVCVYIPYAHHNDLSKLILLRPLLIYAPFPCDIPPVDITSWPG